MKKIFILMMALMMSFCVANAQLATENAKFFDNTYVGVGGQVSTPLDFDGVFPLNGGVSVVLGKQLTPVFGVNIEDNVWFSSHSNGSHAFGVPHFDGLDHNVVRGNYLGLNGTVNFMNLFGGYKGTPRLFEVQAIGGLGWWHVFVPNMRDGNDLAVKTGVNFLFNLGQKKAHGIYIQPAVLWNMTTPGSTNNPVAFNKMGAQLALQVGYVYRFKTSNGTHHFKVYDVGAMNAELVRLNEELAKKPQTVTVEKVVEKVVEAPATEKATGFGVNETVYFAFDSAELDDRAKETLNQLGENGVYVVDAWASSEGTTEYNLKLSQRRADAVKAYLEGRGAKVESATGHGVQFGTTTGRVAIVRLK